MLRRGGNAMDAAIAGAATLGVTEPYSAGLAGGGFIVYYDARRGRIHTIDGRETAPRAMTPTSLEGIPFEQAVTSGLSAGVPGSVAQWELALRRFGTISLRQALRPAIEVAREGFTVDQTFHDQTAANAARFKDFTSSAALFLPGGAPPRSAPRSATPSWPRPTACSAGTAAAGCTAAASASRSWTPSRIRRSPRAPPGASGPA
nr:hypothetical protein GCM10020093_095220 [Planobispora longispora]